MKAFIFLLLLGTLSFNVFALTIHKDISKMDEVFETISMLRETNSDISELLIVFDIDNTLIKIPFTLTEPELDEKVLELQKAGLKTICLTARDASLISVTLWQLDQMGFDFTREAIEPYWTHKRKPTYFKKYLNYTNGVMFAGGQNKGLSLKYLLKDNFTFKQIIFVDDKLKNTQNVYDVFSGSDIEIASFHYL